MVQLANMLNFVTIGQTLADISYIRFSIFQDGGRLPSWIYCLPVWDHPQRVAGSVYRCAKFGWNQLCS